MTIVSQECNPPCDLASVTLTSLDDTWAISRRLGNTVGLRLEVQAVLSQTLQTQNFRIAIVTPRHSHLKALWSAPVRFPGYFRRHIPCAVTQWEARKTTRRLAGKFGRATAPNSVKPRSPLSLWCGTPPCPCLYFT